jgi:hypothetical protein
MRSILIVACIATVCAGEGPDPRVQVRAVWNAASKVGDVWTCLQAEAWARDQKPAIRLGPAIGQSQLIGSPLLALPEGINQIHDLGERVVLTSNSRVHVVASDGRPLQPAAFLQPQSWRHAIGFSAEAACSGATHPGEGGRILELGAVTLRDGKRSLAVRTSLRPGQDWVDHMAVADDGSAVAATVATIAETGAQSNHMVVLAAVGAKTGAILEATWHPSAVGRKAAWLVARGGEGLVLVRGERREPVGDAAAGPGLCAVLAERQFRVILVDGAESVLNTGFVVGHHPQIETVGGWLVAASGHGARAVSQGDLLGDGAGAVSEQPPTLALWRWADLAADPAAKPHATMTGRIVRDERHPAGLYLWTGNQLDILDLTGDEPVRVPHITAAGPIHDAWTTLHGTRVSLGEGRYAIHGPDGAELWNGVCGWIDARRRDLALASYQDGERRWWMLHTLDRDPAKRTSVRLSLPEQNMDRIHVSAGKPDRVVAFLGGGPWWLMGLDGAVTRQGNEVGPPPVRPPGVGELGWSFNRGRFYRDGGRALPKSALPEDPMQRVVPQDAWRVGTTTMVLDRRGNLLVSGRRRGEWSELEGAYGGDRFVLVDGQIAVLDRDANQLAATLMAGPKLGPGGPAAGRADLPPGLWRVDDRRFVVPKGKQYSWDEERHGWAPIRLRSPDASGLFVITPSVIIELDPDAAKYFGRL